MKPLLTLATLASLAGSPAFADSAQINAILGNLRWYGQASVRLESAGKSIWIDPFKLDNQTQLGSADVVLITHSHSDHLSPPDLIKICSPKTVIVAPRDCGDKLQNIPKAQLLTLLPGEKTTVGGIEVMAVPAYNVKKVQFHPQTNQWVGYVLTIDGVRIYQTGDTERIPEMKQTPCDIMLVPLGQTYTMNSVEEAVSAVLDTGATVAIPIHYGMYEGKASDAERFRQLLDGKVRVIIKEP